MTRDPSRDWTTNPRAHEPAITSHKKPTLAGTGGSTGQASAQNASSGGGGAGGAGAQARSYSNSTTSPKLGPAANPSPTQNVKPNPSPSPSQTPSPNQIPSASQKQAPAAAAAATTTAAPPAPPARDLHAGIQIKGLKGTLNKIDVQQAMEARQADLDVCIERSRRSVRWVSGAMRFGCKVDPGGHVIEMKLLSSNLGHRELERCVREIVATTEFKKPSGNAIAEFAWGMNVEPAPDMKPADAGSAKLFTKSLHKRAHELFETCEARRGKLRLRVTAYVASDGRVLSAGAVPVPARADDKVDCLLAELQKWRVGKPRRASKISFELR